MRDGVSVVACDFPVHVPAVPLQSDARETALGSCESRCTVADLPASLRNRNAPAGTEIDGLPNVAIVSGVMTAPVTDGHWPAGRGIGPNRKLIALLDRGPIGTESTAPSTRSTVI
jgi:hypothetical protein